MTKPDDRASGGAGRAQLGSPAPLAYSVAQTAEALGCSETTVRRMIASGQLQAVRLCGRVVVPVVAIEKLLGMERQPPSPDVLVKAFAALVGVTDGGLL
jgi:excisionase family DNA binding protein